MAERDIFATTPLLGEALDEGRESCGAVNIDDWDACGACPDCNPEAECYCGDIDSCDVAEALSVQAYRRAGYTATEADPD